MKKFLSLFLCAVMLLVPVTASANTPHVEPFTKMGDVNLDGKVSASDARKALRISASLDSAEDISMLSIDADGNGKITSADARLILRNSAGLAEFTCGFDGNGLSNSLKALKSDTFIMNVSYDGMSFKIIKKVNNIHVISPDMSGDLSQMGMEDCGVMFCEDKLYMTYTSKGSNVAMYIPAEMYDRMGISADDVTDIAENITSMLPDEFGIPERHENDGAVTFKYNIDENGAKSVITVDEYGIIRTIESVTDAGTVYETVVITQVSAEVSSDYFDLSNYSLI